MLLKLRLRLQTVETGHSFLFAYVAEKGAEPRKYRRTKIYNEEYKKELLTILKKWLTILFFLCILVYGNKIQE